MYQAQAGWHRYTNKRSIAPYMGTLLCLLLPLNCQLLNRGKLSYLCIRGANKGQIYRCSINVLLHLKKYVMAVRQYRIIIRVCLFIFMYLFPKLSHIYPKNIPPLTLLAL